jgi:hypothetical protein
LKHGAPDRIRTCDLCLRRATLYPAELRARFVESIAQVWLEKDALSGVLEPVTSEYESAAVRGARLFVGDLPLRGGAADR